MGKTVNEQIAKGRALAEGLKNNLEAAAERGITAEMIEKLEEICAATQLKGEEQDALNAAYHDKTAEVSELMLELKRSINDLKQVIKPYYAQAEWARFGIADKK